VRQTVALEAMLADEARVHAEAERFRAREEREEAEQDSPWLYYGISEDETNTRPVRRPATARAKSNTSSAVP
jgi:hypothetical protein